MKLSLHHDTPADDYTRIMTRNKQRFTKLRRLAMVPIQRRFGTNFSILCLWWIDGDPGTLWQLEKEKVISSVYRSVMFVLDSCFHTHTQRRDQNIGVTKRGRHPRPGLSLQNAPRVLQKKRRRTIIPQALWLFEMELSFLMGHLLEIPREHLRRQTQTQTQMLSNLNQLNITTIF